MDPPGVFIVYEYFFTFFIREDTDIRAGEVGNLLSWQGLDPGIWMLWGFSSYLCQLLQIRCHFVFTIALGQLHICTGIADFHMLANPLGSHTKSAEGQ